jgi:hypothetical protein
LRRIADFLEIEYEELRQTPCNTFQKGEVTINIFSPDDATYTNFTNIKPDEMRNMYKGGKRIVMDFFTKLR